MPEGATRERRPARPAAVEALLLLYLPQLTPFVTGLVDEHDGTFSTLIQHFALLPGAIPGVVLAGESWWFYVAASLASLAIFGLVFQIMRRLPHWGLRLFIGLILGAASAANTTAIASVLLA